LGEALVQPALEERTILLNKTVLNALLENMRGYAQRFGETRLEWFLFPRGGRFPSNPAL
jgi:hypothetical protein